MCLFSYYRAWRKKRRRERQQRIKTMEIALSHSRTGDTLDYYKRISDLMNE